MLWESAVPYDGCVSRLSPSLAPPDADGAPTAPPVPRASRRLVAFGVIAATVVALDQATKLSVRAWLDVGERWPDGAELLRIAHVENSGAAFGILEGAGPFLLLSSLVAVLLVGAYLWLSPPDDPLYGAALALVLGGAAGNLIDRASRGTVTDFIDPARYPAFNLADSAIVVGIGALVVLTFLGERRAGAEHLEQAVEDGS
jgi:signal peptidase II